MTLPNIQTPDPVGRESCFKARRFITVGSPCQGRSGMFSPATINH